MQWKGGGSRKCKLALSLIYLGMMLLPAAGMRLGTEQQEQLLMLSEDVERKPGPVSHKSLSDWLTKLLIPAPVEVREVLPAWDPVKPTVRADIQTLKGPKLRTAVAWLYNISEDSLEFKKQKYHTCNKETLSLLVMLGLERLLPDECGTCHSEYTVERQAPIPVLQCKGCLQGFHMPCLPMGQGDMAQLPGVLYWLCPRCKDGNVLKTELGGG